MSRPHLNQKYKKRLEKNIVKFAWYKIFTKRVYLPLIAVQLVLFGQVTIEQIALIAIITSLVTLILQVPSGYLADKVGKKTSMVIGAAISAPSPLFYVFMPDFTGGLIASVLFFGGYAFQSGAVEALLHDTLKALRRERDYAKVMGRAQSYGLIGNVILIALVPATYVINTSLPFILGFFSLVAMLWLVASFEHPVEKTKVTGKNPFKAAAAIVTWQNISLFIFAGFTAGVANMGGQYRELMMQDIGIAVSLFGVFIAISSIVGAVFGWYISILSRLRPALFYLLDLIFLSTTFLMIGFGNSVIIVVSWIILMAYVRVRMIVFHAKLIDDLQHPYKATLISSLNVFVTIGDIVAVTAIAQAVGLFGYINGHFSFGLFVIGVGILLWLAVVRSTSGKRMQLKQS